MWEAVAADVLKGQVMHMMQKGVRITCCLELNAHGDDKFGFMWSIIVQYSSIQYLGKLTSHVRRT